MTEEHVCEWYATGNYSGGSDGAMCKVRGCREELSYQQVDTRINAAERYQELIMAIGNKYDGETRHETALRYILEAERGSGVANANIPEGK